MDDVYQRLSVFRVELEGSGGVVGMRGHGSSLLGHPVHVVRWVRDRLKSQDRKLKAVGWISLGSVTGLQAVIHGSQVRARYTGLIPGEVQEVVINFNNYK